MARAALGWTIDDLAGASDVNRRSIITFENEGSVLDSTIAKLKAALEREGVVFVPRGVYIGGVVPPADGR